MKLKSLLFQHNVSKGRDWSDHQLTEVRTEGPPIGQAGLWVLLYALAWTGSPGAGKEE